MSETICPDCGERNIGRVEFCGACGAFLAWDGPVEVAATNPPPRMTGPVITPGHTGADPGAVQTQRPAAPYQPPTSGDRPPASAPAAGLPNGTRSSAPPPQPQPQSHSATRPGAAITSPSSAPPSGSVGPPQPPPDAPCPRCGVENNEALRFCRKCGLALKGPTLQQASGARTSAPAERASWWSRHFGGGNSNTRRAARAAYRHSLPLRYRALRWVMALAGVAAVVGLLTVLGRNPVGWVSDRIEDLRGDLIQVTGLTAYAEPKDPAALPANAATTASGGAAPSTDGLPVGDATSATAGASTAPQSAALASGAAGSGVQGSGVQGSGVQGSAEDLLDNRADTAWSTPWSADVARVAAQAACVPPQTPTGVGAPGSVVLVPPQPIAVRQMSIAAGLPKDDARRVQQWRPKTIQLAYSDGHCQQLVLTDADGLQQVSVDPVQSAQIRLSVVDAYPPLSDQPVDQLSITDIRLFQRP